MVCQAEVWRPNGVNLATVRSNRARTRVVPVNSKVTHPPGILRAFDRSFAPYSGKSDSKWGPPARAIDFRVGDALYTAFMGLWVIAPTFIVPCSFFLEHLRTWRGAHEHQPHDLGENPSRPLLLLFGFHLFLFLSVLHFAPLSTTCIEPWND